MLRIQFLKAVAVALWFSLIRWDRPCDRFRGFLILLLGWSEKASPEITAARNAECRKCPIFYAKLQTCGSPLDIRLFSEGKPMGCWCHTPTKNALLNAPCWLRDHTDGEHGWPKELYA